MCYGFCNYVCIFAVDLPPSSEVGGKPPPCHGVNVANGLRQAFHKAKHSMKAKMQMQLYCVGPMMKDSEAFLSAYSGLHMKSKKGIGPGRSLKSHRIFEHTMVGKAQSFELQP